MLYLNCDYNCGAHPAIMRRLEETNYEYTGTYGIDKYTESAKQRIREACGDPDADIFFLIGGTQTNATVIDALLKPWQGAVSAPSGHINVHEAGAIEFTGHKVIALPNHDDGKIRPHELEEVFRAYRADESRDHIVEPELVYLSFPTELGTMYSAQELTAIHNVTKKYNGRLYIDGARLGYALGAEGNDVTLEYLAEHCEAFYIGGTKVGALFGEAIVFPHHGAPEHFFTFIKQHGALLAKGRITGLQFDTLFTDGLYEEIGRQADILAKQIPELFVKYDKGLLAVNSRTNQQFIIIRNILIPRLSEHVKFEKWGAVDAEHTMCRFVTGWSTTQEDIDELEKILATIAD